MADAVSTSRFAITAIAPRARVRRARRLAAAATTGARFASRRRRRVFGEASAEAAESVAKDGGDDPDSGSPEMFDNLANIFLKRDQSRTGSGSSRRASAGLRFATRASRASRRARLRRRTPRICSGSPACFA